MWYGVRNASLIQQLNSGSSLILLVTSYSARSRGYNAFKFLIPNHCKDSSFHSTWIFYPTVVLFGVLLPLLDTMNINRFGISHQSSLLSHIPLINWKWLPSESTWKHTFSEIIFAVSLEVDPSQNPIHTHYDPPMPYSYHYPHDWYMHYAIFFVIFPPASLHPSWVSVTQRQYTHHIYSFLFFLSFGPASNVPKLTHYGVV